MTDRNDLREALRSLPAAVPLAGARERSWSNLTAGPETTPRRWPVAVALAAAVVGLVGTMQFGRSARSVTPAPPFRVASSGAGPAKRLADGAPVDTSRDAVVGDGGTLLAWLARGSQARIGRRGEATILFLASGEAHVWVAPRSRRAAFEVVTPASRVRVVGTLFTVRSGGAGDAVWVAHGTVEVESGRSTRRLRSGADWSSGTARPAILEPEESRRLEALGKSGVVVLDRDLASRPSVTPPMVAEDRHGGGAGGDRGKVEAPAVALPVERPRSPARAPSRTSPSPDATAVAAPPAVAEPAAEPEAAAAPATAEPPAESAPAAEPDAPFRQARTLEREGHPLEALALYREIAAGSDSSAELALHRAARLEQRVLHDPSGALATLRACARRFPNGVVRHEVDLSIIDLLVRMGHRAEADREATDFLRRWPSSERRADVEAIRNRLRRSVP